MKGEELPDMPVRHIVFTGAGAETLRDALREAGRPGDVISFPDDVSVGPIQSQDVADRDSYWVDVDPRWGEAPIAPRLSEFWRQSLSPDVELIAWTSRRCSWEYAGFLCWLSRLGGRPAKVVDLTDVVSKGRLTFLGMLKPDEFRDLKPWEAATPIDGPSRVEQQGLWRKLQAENAPLRIVEGGTLRSAPHSEFDDALISHATDSWQPAARFVGHVIGHHFIDDDIQPVIDIFLAIRLSALAADGALEGRPLPAKPGRAAPYGYEFRLPSTA
jgi:hypothetical protein